MPNLADLPLPDDYLNAIEAAQYEQASQTALVIADRAIRLGQEDLAHLWLQKAQVAATLHLAQTTALVADAAATGVMLGRTE